MHIINTLQKKCHALSSSQRIDSPKTHKTNEMHEKSKHKLRDRESEKSLQWQSAWGSFNLKTFPVHFLKL